MEDAKKNLVKIPVINGTIPHKQELRYCLLYTSVGQNIARQLEGRVSFRRAVKTAVASTMRMGAEGIKIQVSGRVGGAEMARSETIKAVSYTHLVPLSEMFGYVTVLRTISSGRATSSMEFSHFEEVPANLAKAVSYTHLECHRP